MDRVAKSKITIPIGNQISTIQLIKIVIYQFNSHVLLGSDTIIDVLPPISMWR